MLNHVILIRNQKIKKKKQKKQNNSKDTLSEDTLSEDTKDKYNTERTKIANSLLQTRYNNETICIGIYNVELKYGFINEVNSKYYIKKLKRSNSLPIISNIK